MKLSDVYVMVLEANYPGHWGKGRTLEEALENARNPKEYMAYLVHPKTKCDGFGSMVYPNPDNDDKFDPVLFHWKMSKQKMKKIQEEIDRAKNRQPAADWVEK